MSPPASCCGNANQGAIGAQQHPVTPQGAEGSQLCHALSSMPFIPIVGFNVSHLSIDGPLSPDYLLTLIHFAGPSVPCVINKPSKTIHEVLDSKEPISSLLSEVSGLLFST